MFPPSLARLSHKSFRKQGAGQTRSYKLGRTFPNISMMTQNAEKYTFHPPHHDYFDRLPTPTTSFYAADGAFAAGELVHPADREKKHSKSDPVAQIPFPAVTSSVWPET